MRRVVVTISCAAFLLLTFAAAGGARNVVRGRVTGLVRLCGGPAPGRCFSNQATVSVVTSRHVVVAKQQTRDGRFSFALVPGGYTLVARTGDLRRERPIVIRANRLLHANIVFSVP
ncbi:MAG TPA: hypothetical protein VGG41_06245 [Solirubrobacteraceae bacterium]|jgi:hypothetical protein